MFGGHIEEVIVVVNHQDLHSAEQVRRLQLKSRMKIRLLLTELTGQHNKTYLGVVSSTTKYVLTCDDDVVFNDTGLCNKVMNTLPGNAEMVYITNRSPGLFARVKMIVVSLTIRFVSHNRFKVWKGSSLRVINTTLLQSLMPLDIEFIYLDALFPYLGYQASTLDSKFYKSKHGLKRYTIAGRMVLLWRSIKYYR